MDRIIVACNGFSKELASLGWDNFVAIDKNKMQSPPVGPRVVVVAIVAEGSDPSAIAWHTEDSDGRLEIETGVAAVLNNGGGVLDGGTANDSVLAAVLHEIGETEGDEHVNLWFDRFDGTEGAYENADPVQNSPLTRTYNDPHTGQPFSALVSNFVSRSWFDPQARTDGSVQFDLSGAVKAPCTLHSGYMVIRPTGQTQDVWGHQQKAKDALLAAGHDVEEYIGIDGRVRWFVSSSDMPAWKKARAKRRVARRLSGHPGKVS